MPRAPLREYFDSCRGKKKLKRYFAYLSLFERICWEKIESLYDAKLLDRSLYAGARRYRRIGRKTVPSRVRLPPGTRLATRKRERP